VLVASDPIIRQAGFLAPRALTCDRLYRVDEYGVSAMAITGMRVSAAAVMLGLSLAGTLCGDVEDSPTGSEEAAN